MLKRTAHHRRGLGSARACSLSRRLAHSLLADGSVLRRRLVASRLLFPLRLVALAALCAAFVALLPATGARAQDDGDPIGEPPLIEPAQADDGNAIPPIVIHEIHSKPDLDTERLEFVEFYNGSNQPAPLGFWTLSGGIDYTFPSGAVVPARSYLLLAEDPGALRARYGVNALGPFRGGLALEGERLVLRSAEGVLVDEVAYANGFPWPTVGQSPAYSLQLLNPAWDNALPGAWRSGAPTPGRPNARLLGNAPPFVSLVRHEPAQPRPGQPVTVFAAARDPDGIGSMKVAYKAILPGRYERLTDPSYNEGWTIIDMAPTGQVDEQGHAVYSVQIPGAIQQQRALVRYRVYATDTGGRRAYLPYPDDPQHNFAYFAYGDVPAWQGSIAGGAPTAFDFGAMRPLPVMQFIARRDDVADAMFMPDSPIPDGYMGNEYLWQGTFVYNNVVYDHVTFRARGGFYRYATGKSNWKINFLPGHRLQMVDNYGRPYGVARDKLNLSSVIQQTHRDRRGEQGMFESMSYRLFNMAGVPAPYTDFIHWRVITDAQEYTTQYRGDFWGLYLAIEQPDESFVEQHGLPDGNLYKIENNQGELNNLGVNGPANGSDVQDFMYAYNYTYTSSDWWRANFDLENYYSFRAILEFVHHYDVDQGKNYFYYRNPETLKWSILPWDVDLTWFVNMAGTGVEPFVNILGRPEFNLEYHNRLRELRDLLLNEEQIFRMLDEHAGFVDTAQNGYSMVTADRFLWDNNPIYNTRYVIPERSQPMQFYIHAPGRSFRGMVTLMQEHARDRMAFLDSSLAQDAGSIPYTPGIDYSGAAGYPVDGLRFNASGFGDPQGPSTFAAMEWRFAEVTDPSAPAYDPNAPILYEINAVWESGRLDRYSPTMTPPAGALQAGHAYRVRVRMQDTSGYWSHWSTPLQFVARPPAQPPLRDLAITEIMYHPAPWGNIPDEDLEFIEIKNLGNKALSLKGLRVTGGIDYAFGDNATIAPFGFVVLARSATAFQQRYAELPDGEYDRRLSNSGDTVAIRDPWGRAIVSVTYRDSAPWPQAADGSGYSLSYNPLAGAQDDPFAWSASRAIGGSPGSLEPAEVWINEVVLFPESARAVELHNASDLPIDISNWYISDDPSDPRKVRLPEGSRIPGRGYLVIDAQRLAMASYDGPLRIQPDGRTTLVLTAGRPDGWVGPYQTLALVPYTEAGVSYGRVLDSLGFDHMVAQREFSLGGPNGAVRTGPVVISALHYFPAPGSSAPIEYIELANTAATTVTLYAPGNPALTWQVQGAAFSIPAGTVLPPNGRLLLTPTDAATACAQYGGRGLAAILGPYAQPLSNTGQEITLLRPVESARGGWAVADEVAYSAQPPWPAQAAGQGAALRRADWTIWGSDPAAWQISVELPGPGTPTGRPVSLCSFMAEPERADGIQAAGAQAASARAVPARITWALDAPPAADIAGFTVWRSATFDRASAVRVGAVAAAAGVPLTQDTASTTSTVTAIVYSVLDADAPAVAYYWLEAARPGSTPGAIPLGVTALFRPWQQTFLPLVRR